MIKVHLQKRRKVIINTTYSKEVHTDLCNGLHYIPFCGGGGAGKEGKVAQRKDGSSVASRTVPWVPIFLGKGAHLREGSIALSQF